MNSAPAQPSTRRLWRAAALLAVVFTAGLLTGVGGSFFFVRHTVRAAFTAVPGGPAPIDRALDRFEAELARQASLTPDERGALHERMQVVALRFKDSRQRFVGELREAVQLETENATQRVQPARRAVLRGLIQRRLQRWGIDVPVTPAPAPSVENL